MMSSPTLRLAAGLASATLCLALLPAAPALAATTLIPDIDGDSLIDVVVGLPWAGGGTGMVEVVYSGDTHVQITPNDLGLDTDYGAQFGAATLVRDLNADGYADLIVGQINDVANETSGIDPAPGLVHVLYGSATGLDLTSRITLSAGDPNDLYGMSLATLGGATPTALVVGAPLYWADGESTYGGAVVVHPIVDGLPALSGTPITQNSPLVPGSSELGDGFGYAVAASGNSVIVGAPFENVGSVSDAGAVTFLTFTGTTVSSAKGVHQGSPYVPESVSSGDRFGYSVAASGDLYAVGVPFEDVGTAVNAGYVNQFTYSGGVVRPKAGIHQDTTGVPGSNERNDYFGASVSVLRPAVGVRAVAAGAPGEDLGTTADAGTVTIRRYDGASFTTVAMSQGTSPTSGAIPGVRYYKGNYGYLVDTIVEKPTTDGVDVLLAGGFSLDGAVVSLIRSPFTAPSDRADVTHLVGEALSGASLSGTSEAKAGAQAVAGRLLDRAMTRSHR